MVFVIFHSTADHVSTLLFIFYGIDIATMTPLQQKLIKILVEMLKRYNHQYITKEPCRNSSLSRHVFVCEILEGNPYKYAVVSDGETCLSPIVSLI